MKITIKQLKALIKEQVEEQSDDMIRRAYKQRLAAEPAAKIDAARVPRSEAKEIEALKIKIVKAVVSAGGSSRADEISALLDKLVKLVEDKTANECY